MRIALSQGQFALVDDEDYQYLISLSPLKFYAWWNPKTKSFYAKRTCVDENGNRTTVYMHREILGLKKGDKRQGDHVDRNTLDNRRHNLRIATHQQNNFNQRTRSTNKSGYKGVHWHRREGKWRGGVTLNGKEIYCGYHNTAEAAYEAVCEVRARVHGEFASA